MTQPVLNLSSAIAIVKDKAGKVIGEAFVKSPWNSFFQQFTQKPQAVENVIVGISPFDYMPNNVGQVVIRGGTVSAVSLVRGSVIIDMGTDRTILVSIGDIVRITYFVIPTVQFVEL